MKHISIGLVFFAALIVAVIIGTSPEASVEATTTQPTIETQPEVFPHVIKKNSTLFEELINRGFPPLEIQKMVIASRPHKNLNRIFPGIRYQVYFDTAPLNFPSRIKFKYSPIEFLEVARQLGGEWTAEVLEKETEIRLLTYMGEVNSSLWESAESANMDVSLIIDLTEIFAWQVDFAREVRSGDRWRLTVERQYVDGVAVGWGRIVAAEYENDGKLFSATLFRKDGQDYGYFFPDGTSLRRMFLKSPLRYGRISSRFSRRRFHPILKTNRPHLGVDYAAPRGTPVRAVGDGVITFVGNKGGGGKTVTLRHNSTYKTAYKHLSGYAKGIRSGRKVRQGQIIGYVGSTGLATGPHLHFEFYERNRCVDPIGKKFPSADPIPEKHLAEFTDWTRQVALTLPSWEAPAVAAADEDDYGEVYIPRVPFRTN